MSSARLPPRNVQGAVRSRANTWWPDPSSKDWPPRRSSPWHVTHPWLANSSFPRVTLSGELGIAAGISMGLPGWENPVQVGETRQRLVLMQNHDERHGMCRAVKVGIGTILVVILPKAMGILR